MRAGEHFRQGRRACALWEGLECGVSEKPNLQYGWGKKARRSVTAEEAGGDRSSHTLALRILVLLKGWF
jgi:hypothetical protein